MRPVKGLDELRTCGEMRWCSPERGWLAAAEDVVNALVGAGFKEFKREVTTVVSLLALLVSEGCVRICRVAATTAPSMTGRPDTLVV